MVKKNIDFQSAISLSINEVKKIFFSGFNIRRVFMITIIATLAGGFTGINLDWIKYINANNKYAITRNITQKLQHISDSKDKKIYTVINGKEEFVCPYTQKKSIINSPNTWLLIALASVVMLFVILMLWLRTRFSFVLMNLAATNTTDISAPFKAYSKESDSVFIFLFLFNSISLILIAACIVTAMTIKMSALIAIIAIISLLILAAIINTIIDDFTIPIIFSTKQKLPSAVKSTFLLLKEQKTSFVTYLIVKLFLAMIFSILLFIISLAIILCYVLLLLAPGIAAYGISLLSAVEAFKVSVLIFYAIVIAFPLTLCLFIAILVSQAPVSLFFRLFSLKILSHLSNAAIVIPAHDDITRP